MKIMLRLFGLVASLLIPCRCFGNVSNRDQESPPSMVLEVFADLRTNSIVASEMDSQIGQYEQLADQAPSNAVAHVRLGQAYIHKAFGFAAGEAGPSKTVAEKYYGKSLKEFDRALRLDSANAEAWIDQTAA